MELRDNVLKTLPTSMSSLAKLRVLDLGSNLLEDLVSVTAAFFVHWYGSSMR